MERKSVSDLAKSIQVKRYDQQKYVLHRCGLRRPMYLAEGDPDHDVPHRQEV
jgi:crossover junction endonuclease MUS81